MAQDILDAIDSGAVNLADYDLSGWRMMHIGAQPVPPSLVHRWKKHFPHHLYDTNYGLSESIGPGCVHLGTENIHKVGAIGVPGHGWECRIVDEGGRPVERGQVGELAVRGPGVMKCYYNDPEATAAVLRDGWLLTGDMARADEDGFIFLVDRKKDVIISGGENIYPVQIEDFLRAHEAIKDVAVIGLPEKRLGEIAAAVVQLKPDRKLSLAESTSSAPRCRAINAPEDHLRYRPQEPHRQDRETAPEGEIRRGGAGGRRAGIAAGGLMSTHIWRGGPA